MPRVICGLDKDGEPCNLFLDGYVKRSMDAVKLRVKKHNWDYVAIVAGIPGSGKSTFARTLAKYCDHDFKLKYIAFTADEFIRITNTCPEYSAVILDESFASLNSRVTMSPDFVKIINHLQLIRQKHLFIFLCLPNFFDLSKGIAIFRSSHLFYTYASDEGRRGRVMAWGRNEKRVLYIKGGKYMNYGAVKANYYARYNRNSMILDEDLYEEKKNEHLLAQEQKKPQKVDWKEKRNEIMMKVFEEYKKFYSDLTYKEIYKKLTTIFQITWHRIEIIITEMKKEARENS